MSTKPGARQAKRSEPERALPKRVRGREMRCKWLRRDGTCALNGLRCSMNSHDGCAQFELER